jgi:hypothetical protein
MTYIEHGSPPRRQVSPPLAVLAAWALPGLGYLLIGETARGLVTGITIITLFILGLLLAGIRVIDVPGYDRLGGEVRVDVMGRRMESTTRDPSYAAGSWAVTSRGFFAEIANKPWYVPQLLIGPICLVASKLSVEAARSGVPMGHARLSEIGTLYTAVAGMLNLLIIIDAAHRAAGYHASDETSATTATNEGRA